jgi:hypothetical protein
VGSSAGGEKGDPGVKKDGRDVGTWEAVVVAAACSRALAVGGAEEVVGGKFPSLNSQCPPPSRQGEGKLLRQIFCLPSRPAEPWTEVW